MKTYWQRIKEIVGPAFKKDFDEIGQKRTRKALEKFIIKNTERDTLLLDAGCNTGVEAFRLYDKGYTGKYFGVDSNGKAIKIAKSNLKGYPKAKFLTGDLEKLKFRRKYFDIVFSKDVVEHQRYYKKILEELSRVTKKYLILSLFIKPSLFFNDRIKLHKDGYYLNRYNRSKLFRFMEKNNFKKPEKIYEDWQDVVYVFEKIV